MERKVHPREPCAHEYPNSASARSQPTLAKKDHHAAGRMFLETQRNLIMVTDEEKRETAQRCIEGLGMDFSQYVQIEDDWYPISALKHKVTDESIRAHARTVRPELSDVISRTGKHPNVLACIQEPTVLHVTERFLRDLSTTGYSIPFSPSLTFDEYVALLNRSPVYKRFCGYEGFIRAATWRKQQSVIVSQFIPFVIEDISYLRMQLGDTARLMAHSLAQVMSIHEPLMKALADMRYDQRFARMPPPAPPFPAASIDSGHKLRLVPIESYMEIPKGWRNYYELDYWPELIQQGNTYVYFVEDRGSRLEAAIISRASPNDAWTLDTIWNANGKKEQHQVDLVKEWLSTQQAQ